MHAAALDSVIHTCHACCAAPRLPQALKAGQLLAPAVAVVKRLITDPCHPSRKRIAPIMAAATSKMASDFGAHAPADDMPLLEEYGVFVPEGGARP